ncbi:TniQ family protein [Rhodocyclus tenuis]|uniref:TniQ domain-containing protein n=1 Tax=Rhodocyclus tenuis TaxID=1066 RepID=A0A840FVT1_RHOTE|nr:TniQ family protein [Rhodocyclus tenuis]MBB4245844.1 hypothetical protein [Rhodocyclus tenuis]
MRLFNVPAPQPFEAASSWISRFALSQGISTGEALEHFGADPALKGKIDGMVIGEVLRDIRRQCGLPPTALLVHERVMTSFRKIEPTGDSLLLHKAGSKALFNFCPACVKSMRTPHIPIHWRFIAWRWCPEHDSILESRCRMCGERQSSLVDLAMTSPGKNGRPWFNACQYCGVPFKSFAPCQLIKDEERIDWPIQRKVLVQGRAFLASLFDGYYSANGIVKNDIAGIREDISLKAFEVPIDLLSAEWFRGDADESQFTRMKRRWRFRWIANRYLTPKSKLIDAARENR